MNLATTIEIYAAGFGSTSVGLKTKHHGVMSPHMAKRGGLTHLSHTFPKMGHMGHMKKMDHMEKMGHIGKMKAEELEADASPSDLASHHTWLEPSATDVNIRNWRNKRALEKSKGRNMDPFEADVELGVE